MSHNFLKSFNSILPPSQQERLKDMMLVDPDPNLSTEQLEQEVQNLLSQLGKNSPTMQLRIQSGKTNSLEYNTTLREVLADLSALYHESTLLDAIISNNAKINLSTITEIESEINRIERKIESINLLADNHEGYSSTSRDDFFDEEKRQRSREGSAEGLFADRDSPKGEVLPKELDAHVDKSVGCLELPLSSSNYDRLHLNGSTVATIEILEQVGEGFKDFDPSYSIDKAIDIEEDTFWGEVILADEPLRVPLDGVDRGAVCKFKITLPNPSTVSEITILPYSEFPIELVSIAYTIDDVDSLGGYIKEWDRENPCFIDSSFKYNFPAVTAKSLIITICQQHSNRQSYIITEEQKQNRQLWSKVSAIEKEITLNTPWIENEDIENPSVTQDKIDELDSTWQIYLKDKDRKKSIIDRIIVALRKIVTFGQYEEPKEKAPKRVQVDKFEYIYGAYDIGVYGKEYHPTGIYVSKPHNMAGNIMQVVLEAEEEHPVFYKNYREGQDLRRGIIQKKIWSGDSIINSGDPLRRTSVEYYVTAKENPENKDWIPILPLGQNGVNQEVIRFSDGRVGNAKLRFPCDKDKPFHLYKNEEPLRYGIHWSFSEEKNGLLSDQKIEIRPGVWDPNSIFSIDYYPSGNPHLVDFIAAIEERNLKPSTTSEYFFGTDKNCRVQLSRYPFVDRARLIEDRDKQEITYNPVRVTLNPDDIEGKTKEVLGIDGFSKSDFHIKGKDKAIESEIRSTRDKTKTFLPARLLNVTEYFEAVNPPLRPYDTRESYPTFEYAHEGRNVYFTETFKHDGPVANYDKSNGNAIIKVEYDYIVSGIRVKIILRRTSSADASVSPRVKSYTLKGRSLL